MALTSENTASLDRSARTFKPWALAVRAVIRDDAGRWLLLRRSGRCKHFVGTWELPGGKVDPGESIDGALRREVHEETGLLVRTTGLAGMTHGETAEVHIVVLYFHTAPDTHTVGLSAEHDDFTWLQRSEMRRFDLDPQLRDFLQEYPDL